MLFLIDVTYTVNTYIHEILYIFPVFCVSKPAVTFRGLQGHAILIFLWLLLKVFASSLTQPLHLFRLVDKNTKDTDGVAPYRLHF